jgi:hypothetical protein
MNLNAFIIVLLGVAACAANEAEKPPAATPKTEPSPATDTRGAEPATKTTPVPPATPETPKTEPKEPASEHPSDVHGPSTRNDPTPEDQGNAASDLAITQRIRKAVVSDSSLSFNAKNVKIITEEGAVTLRGDVKSEAERYAIERYAHQAAEKHAVHNELAVRE